MPLLTTGMQNVSAWLDSHGDDVARFFHDAGEMAGKAASGIIGVFGAVQKGWDMIPEPVRNFLLAGFAADKTIKFLFGFDPAKMILGKLAGGIFEKGGTPANPLYVSDVAGGLGKAGAGGLASGLGGLLLGGMLAVTIAGITAEVADMLGFKQQRQDLMAQKGLTNEQALALQIQQRGGLDSMDVRSRSGALQQFMNAGTTYAQALAEATGKITNGLGAVSRHLGSQEGATSRLASSLTAAGNRFDKPSWLAKWEATMGRTPKALAEAMHAALAAVQGGKATVAQVSLLGANAGRGSATSVRGEIAALSKLLGTTHDPALQAAITRSLGELKASLPKHEQVAAAYAQAEKIVRSSESTAQKLRDLDKIKNDIAKVSPTVASKIGELEGVVRRSKPVINLKGPTAKAFAETHVRVFENGDVSSSNQTSAASSDPRWSGYVSGLAKGATGIARSPTAAIFGEAGTEGVAIIRNPRPFSGGELGGGGAPITLHVNPVTNVRVSARDIEAVTKSRNFFARGKLLNRVSYAAAGG
jgi:hypothetical protein